MWNMMPQCIPITSRHAFHCPAITFLFDFCVCANSYCPPCGGEGLQSELFMPHLSTCKWSGTPFFLARVQVTYGNGAFKKHLSIPPPPPPPLTQSPAPWPRLHQPGGIVSIVAIPGLCALSVGRTSHNSQSRSEARGMRDGGQDRSLHPSIHPSIHPSYCSAFVKKKRDENEMEDIGEFLSKAFSFLTDTGTIMLRPDGWLVRSVMKTQMYAS